MIAFNVRANGLPSSKDNIFFDDNRLTSSNVKTSHNMLDATINF
jgi:hypothetical protein